LLIISYRTYTTDPSKLPFLWPHPRPLSQQKIILPQAAG